MSVDCSKDHLLTFDEANVSPIQRGLSAPVPTMTEEQVMEIEHQYADRTPLLWINRC